MSGSTRSLPHSPTPTFLFSVSPCLGGPYVGEIGEDWLRPTDVDIGRKGCGGG